MAEDGDKPEPRSYQEALLDSDWEKWKEGMGDEMVSLKKNQTWVLVDKPEHLKPRKAGIPGVEAPRFKVRLVAKVFLKRKEWIIRRSSHLL